MGMVREMEREGRLKGDVFWTKGNVDFEAFARRREFPLKLVFFFLSYPDVL